MDLKATVYYHANCVDGCGAAWVFDMCYSDYTSVQYHPCNYDDDVVIKLWDRDTDVYVLDFSFSRKQLTEMARESFRVIVLDHHQSAINKLQDWDDAPSNLQLHLDNSKCGTRLTWEYMIQGAREGVSTTMPPLIEYIEDNDLGKWELPNTEEISAVLANTPKTFTNYTALNNSIVHGLGVLLIKGDVVLQTRQLLCESILETSWHPIYLAEYLGYAANCPSALCSEVANMLALESGTFGAAYYVKSDGHVKFSLRSRTKFNVRLIAEMFGGGGHDKAAGFTVDKTEFHTSGVMSIESHAGEKE